MPRRCWPDLAESIQWRGDEVGVSVPATSANLGAGFDSLGVALDVHLVAVAVARQDRRIIAHGDGASDLPAGDDNLVWQALCAWCDHAGTPHPDISVSVRSGIPLQRGMGSSSAAAVAGLVLGQIVTQTMASRAETLELATGMEGHPDNAAAAIHGGIVVCTDDGEVTRLSPSSALRPVLIIPDVPQSTSKARAVLADMVSLRDAAANTASAVHTVTGLTGLGPLRPTGMVDRLHEPTRLALMPNSGAVVAALRAAGTPAALSGAGPTVLAVLPAGDPDAVAQVEAVVSSSLPGGGVRIQPTDWDLAGVEICPPV